ncbi:MAG TPA: hypothetical protein VF556_17415 [Pyrinomonadaceae bacterium]
MIKLGLFLALCLTISSASVFAQSTIFNAPSTDVSEKNRTYVEVDFIGHFDKYKNGGFQTYGWRATRGVTKNIELGANLFYSRDGGDEIPFSVHPNAKWQVYKSERKKFAVSTGIIASVPLNRAAGSRPTAMFYSNVSKEISQLKNMRATFGGYKMLGTKEEDGDSAGVFVGVEQPLFKRVSFTGDWFSGNNDVGYATPGLSFVTGKNQILGVGYSFGNNGRGNNAFTTFYGITF